jgi:hypothetical protein
MAEIVDVAAPAARWPPRSDGVVMTVLTAIGVT